eukprot:scaffold326441_cov18-Prasinocladus_malaysianus.AAC.1
MLRYITQGAACASYFSSLFRVVPAWSSTFRSMTRSTKPARQPEHPPPPRLLRQGPPRHNKSSPWPPPWQMYSQKEKV